MAGSTEKRAVGRAKTSVGRQAGEEGAGSTGQSRAVQGRCERDGLELATAYETVGSDGATQFSEDTTGIAGGNRWS